MKYFGPLDTPPGAERVPPPGGDCYACHEPLDADPQGGFTMPFSGGPGDPDELSVHRRCLIRMLMLDEPRPPATTCGGAVNITEGDGPPEMLECTRGPRHEPPCRHHNIAEWTDASLFSEPRWWRPGERPHAKG